MERMAREELDALLVEHAKWLRNDGGKRADLSWADLSWVNLSWANLSGANLSRANLSGANLWRADLSDANLSRANLSRADLWRANLFGCNVHLTVLDPDNTPNADVDGFERDGEYIIGYRTREAGHIDMYRDGRIYAADWFSTCTTECHPGLYLWPSLEQARDFSPCCSEFIRVRTKPADVHRAGTKWRCRWFEVLGKVEE